ncbi:maintenance of mitochondrial structure and function-domain-containing protein [Flagelloscypha sp. PMI_526]|nr:maintenance of mitochondrial structure and function-domain-containing protein [Flagelloscypha sp. PMI_526]
MVIVDIRPDTVSILADAYFAVKEIKGDGSETLKTFLHVPSAIEAEEAEEIGVEHLLRDIKNSTATPVSTRVKEQLASLRTLQQRIKDVSAYLRDVEQGKVPVDHTIVYGLRDVVNFLPGLEGDKNGTGMASDFVTAIREQTNHQLLVVYLSSLVRAVLALHTLVGNKVSSFIFMSSHFSQIAFVITRVLVSLRRKSLVVETGRSRRKG